MVQTFADHETFVTLRESNLYFLRLSGALTHHATKVEIELEDNAQNNVLQYPMCILRVPFCSRKRLLKKESHERKVDKNYCNRFKQTHRLVSFYNSTK